MGRWAKLAFVLAGATFAALNACGDPYSEAEPSMDATAPAADAGAEAADASSPGDAADAGDSSDARGDADSGYRAAVMATGPVAYWRLGEANGVSAKDELGQRNCIYQGAVTLGAAGALTNDSNSSIHGEGTNGSVQCGDVFDFAGNVPFSVELWIKPELIDSVYRRPISKRANGGQGWAIFCQSDTNGCVFEVLNLDAGSGLQNCEVTVPLNTYSHLVATYDTAALRMYLNGIEACDKPAIVTLFDHASPLVIGAYSTGGDHFKGNIDEVAIYDKALGAAAVKAHFDAR